MNTRCIKHINRLSGALALTCLLGVGNAQAYTNAASISTAAENGHSIDSVMAALPYGYLSASAETIVDSVSATEDMQAAQERLEEEARRAEEEARRAEEEAKAARAAAARLESLKAGAVTPRTIRRSSALAADSVIKSNFKKIGTHRLSFYCPCATCNGRSDGKTKIGTRMAEGRTIAVDPRVIPLGSRVYIDGYGVFIAEDTGGAIKGNRIDVCVANHARAYEIGIDYADVYLIG